MVSVYDCSFVRYPELCSPEVRAFVPIVRRAIARGATVHTTSEFVAGEIDEIFGPGLRRSGRLVVIPLGVPSIGTDAQMPAAVAGAARGRRAYVLAIGTLEPRKNLAHLVAAFGTIAATHPDLRLVIAGQDGPARPDVDAAIGRLDPDARAACRASRPGRPTRAAARCSTARRARLSVDLRRLRLPGARSDDASASRSSPRVPVSIPEVAGDAALLVDPTDETRLADAITQLLTDDATRRASSIAHVAATASRYSWEDTALAARGLLSPPGGSGAPLMSVACHAGQLLQPVPGGIGRYVRALLGPPAGAGVDADRVRGRRAAAQPPGRGPVDRSRSPVGQRCATSCGTGSGAPRAARRRRRPRAEPRGPAGARRAARRHRARHRVPPVPRRHHAPGVAFHRRGLRPRAARSRRSSSRRPRSRAIELIREGFEPEGVVLAPLGVDRPVPRDPDEIDVDRRRAPVSSRRSCSRSGPSSRARTSRPSSTRCSSVRTRATRPRARRRRAAGLGRGRRPRPARRARARDRSRGASSTRSTGAPRAAASRRATRGSGSRPSRRSRAARRHRGRRLGARRGRRRRRPAVPAGRRRRADAAASNASWTTPTCARELQRRGPRRAAVAHLGSLGRRPRRRLPAGGRPASATGLTRRLPRRAPAARRLGGARPSGRRRRLHVGARRRAWPRVPRSTSISRPAGTTPPLGRPRAEGAVHAEVPDRRPGAAGVGADLGREAGRPVGVDVWHGPHYTMPLRTRRPGRRHGARPHVLRPSRMARAQRRSPFFRR